MQQTREAVSPPVTLQGPARAVTWINNHVNCDDNLDCDLDIPAGGRKRRDADAGDADSDAGTGDAATTPSDAKGGAAPSDDVSNSKLLDDVCPGLQLDVASGFNLDLVTKTFNDVDKLGSLESLLLVLLSFI